MNIRIIKIISALLVAIPNIISWYFRNTTIEMQVWHVVISWISVIMGIGLYIYAERKNPNRQMIFHSRKSLILFIIGCVSVVLITFLLMN